MKKYLALIVCACCLSTACSSSKKTAQTSVNNVSAVNSKADGTSYEQAVVIQEKSEKAGVDAEYKWLHDNYPGYKTDSQALQTNKGKPYDVLHVTLADGSKKNFYFDISNFFGKW